MFSRILVPIDLCEEGFSDRVLAQAQQVCAPGGTLILLTVVSGYQMPMVGSFFPEGAFDKAFHAVEEQLNAFAATQLKEHNFNIEVLVKEGGRASTILLEAQSREADLIVMASHKQSGVNSGILGSVANKVVNQSPIPVMVVKS